MGWADELYGRGRGEELYGSPQERHNNNSRPGSDRVGALGGVVVNKVAESVLRAIPNANPQTLIGQTINSVKSGFTTRANIRKHENGNVAFSNPIPGLNKFFQSGWSMAHLGSGLTNIDTAYTVERDGREALFSYGTPQGEPSLGQLKADALRSQGNEAAFYNSLSSQIPPDGEAIRAGVIAELTDGDIREVADLSRFQPTYSKAELWFIGRRGKRKVVGQTAAGENIVAYRRPDAIEFWKYYGRMNMAYTFLDTAIGASERALGPGVATQRVYEREVEGVIQSTAKRYGNVRDDGIMNPFAGYGLVGGL